jgi:putative glycosyltransferase (TIGR04372 family)
MTVLKKLNEKKKELFLLLVLSPFLIPLLIVVYIISPVKKLRFGPLNTSGIGHLNTGMQLYLTAKKNNDSDASAIDLYFLSTQTCNERLSQLWARVVCTHPIIYYFYQLNKVFYPFSKKHVIPDRDNYLYDYWNYYQTGNVQLKFNDDEIKEGRSKLAAMGIPESAKFICVFVRDHMYEKVTAPHLDHTRNEFRNAKIEDFLPAMTFLAEQGYYVLRMGKIVEKGLPTLLHPNIIDYAIKYQDDFMDHYIGTTCEYFVSCSSGADSPATISKVPQLFLNAIPVEGTVTWGTSQNLIMPKMIFDQDKNRYLTLDEMMGLEREYGPFKYLNEALRIEDNTKEDILSAVKEMDAIVNGELVLSKKNERLQKVFWIKFKSNWIKYLSIFSQTSQKHCGVLNAKVSPSFLEKNEKHLGLN